MVRSNTIFELDIIQTSELIFARHVGLFNGYASISGACTVRSTMIAMCESHFFFSFFFQDVI